jgi:hypothetical protein
MARDRAPRHDRLMTLLPAVADDPRLAVQAATGPAPAAPGACRSLTAEEIGAASFPASDPPATWTWDPPSR